MSDLPRYGFNPRSGGLQSKEFEQAMNFTHAFCLAQVPGELDALQFKLMEFFGLKYSEVDARKEKKWSKVYETIFPEVVGE